jgi:hypothetical protein
MMVEVVNSYDEFAESEYDIHIDDGPNTQELMQALNQLAHAGMQTGQIKFRDLIELYKKDSVSSLARYLEEAQDKMAQEQQEQAQAQQQHEKELAAQQIEMQSQALQLEYTKLDREDTNRQLDRDNKIQVETLKAMGFAQDQDINENNIPDVLEQSKIALLQQKQTFEQVQKDREHQLKYATDQQKNEIERQKLGLMREEMKNKREIERMKADSALKVAKENKNKFDKK